MVTWEVIRANVLDGLRSLPDQSVQTCVTSPPYYQLRDYGFDDQIGQEADPYLYVDHLVEVFEEVRRALRDDGTLWLNLGDSFAGSGKGAGRDGTIQGQAKAWEDDAVQATGAWPELGIKKKDVIGIPWLVAFALRSAGWYLRSDIIWHKPNPMPESVRDRPTRCHEYIFLMSKSAKYYYDYKGVRQPLREPTAKGIKFGGIKYGSESSIGSHKNSKLDYDASKLEGANLRDVWSVPTHSYSGAHFATFPTRLIEPCIVAGAPASSVVLDPFCGSGTTGVVALRHGRSFVGVEANADYVQMARNRLRSDAPLFNIEAEIQPGQPTNRYDQMALVP